MCDVFEDHPTINQEREKLWPLIQATPNLDWHIITKRYDNVEQNLPWSKTDAPWPNVWLSMSIENDYWAAKRLPFLASLNVAVRGAHVEPLLGPVPSLAQYITVSGLGACGRGIYMIPELMQRRVSMQPAWVKEVKKICDGADVPFFFKQWGSHKPVAAESRWFQSDSTRCTRFKAKKTCSLVSMGIRAHSSKDWSRKMRTGKTQ